MLALVDDWGNPKPGSKGTDWFGFAAVLLKDSQIDLMRNLHCEICELLGQSPANPVHHRNLVFSNKYHIILRLMKKQPAVSLIAVRIHAVTSHNLMQQGWAYRFYGREMVRVATHFADDCGERANVVFHRHKYLNDFDAYIWKRLFHNAWYNAKQDSQRILFQALGDLRVLDDEEETLLGWADCVAHACHLALNPDKRWKQTNTSCLDLLANCIWQGPSHSENARLFGVQLDPVGIPTHLIPDLPYTIRQYWE